MDPPPPSPQRRVLGDFLRARRETISPAVLGLAEGTRRRTPGLRREEVATLAGLSTTWYTWLEQGRDVSVSPLGLARIATTLRLDRAARAYLFDLAGRRDPAPETDFSDVLPPALPACLAAIATPAYVLDRPWNFCDWNAAAATLFAGALAKRDPAPNLLRFVFLDPAARTLLPDWPTRARRVLAEFRADCAAHLEDPPVARLLADLRRDSTDFARLWALHSVTGREGGARMFAHPTLGALRYDQTAFAVVGRTDLTLVVLTQA
jgi:transcriptional regulator with XRE-family HTH domain